MEALTSLAINNTEFFESLFKCIRATYNDKKIGTGFQDIWKTFRELKGGMLGGYLNPDAIFGVIKLLAVQPGVLRRLLWRKHAGEPNKDDLNEFINEHDLAGTTKNYLTQQIDKRNKSNNNNSKLNQNNDDIQKIIELGPGQQRGLWLNILEALTFDTIGGRRDNASTAAILMTFLEKVQPLSGSVLTNNPLLPKDVNNNNYPLNLNLEKLSDDQLLVGKVYLPQDWVNLYISWNMAFILGNLDEYHLLLPKLLIPSTLSAKYGNYMSGRVLSLWMTILFYTFASFDENKTLLTKNKKNPENSPKLKRIIQIFGEKNKEFAKKMFLENECSEEDFQYLCDQSLAWPKYTLMQQVYRMMVRKDKHLTLVDNFKKPVKYAFGLSVGSSAIAGAGIGAIIGTFIPIPGVGALSSLKCDNPTQFSSACFSKIFSR
ncbi:MAG: hypothetical protein GY821_15310 [Gammaproteobacteria bacterium]|nr:hypothetical protein [Gammaproteobacteria bacterium]